MVRKPRDDFEDDGRTIVPMNVDGMPWYTKNTADPFRRGEVEQDKPAMTRHERRGYIRAAVLSALLIAAVFAVGYAAFLLFCRFVWLR